MKDILVTLAVIVIYAFILYKKYAKKQEQQRLKRTRPDQTAAPDMSREQSYTHTYEESAQTSSNTQSYSTEETEAESTQENFSYENIPSQQPFSYENGATANVENVENVENIPSADEAEEENTSILDLSPDELYKGFVYSEILKNPNNQ